MDLDSFSLETTYVDVKLDFSSTVGKMSYGLLRFIYPIKKFYWCWSVLTIKIATMILIMVENYQISSSG